MSNTVLGEPPPSASAELELGIWVVWLGQSLSGASGPRRNRWSLQCSPLAGKIHNTGRYISTGEDDLFRRCSQCEGEVLVQGDEGPVRGVAQVVDCHGATVGHQEKEEEEKQQEVESDGEELKERCTWMACGWSE